MMTESNRSLDELPALIAERKKFEAWVAALEARRDATPAHVFDRVRGDYLARLREVEERFATHRSAIIGETTSLESRRSLLEAEEQMRRDERAELELRAHVGELIGEESESAFATVDDALAKMSLEKTALTTRIDELHGLLDLPGGAPPEQDVAAAGNASDASSASGASGSSSVATPGQPPEAVHAEPAGQTTATSTPPRGATPAAAPAVSGAVPIPGASGEAVPPESSTSSAPSAPHGGSPIPSRPASATPVGADRLVLSEHSATFQRTSGQMPDIDQVLNEPPGPERSTNTPAPTKGARLTPGGRFDELAFLSDIVGLKPDAPAAPAAPTGGQPAVPAREEPRSPLEGMAPARPSMDTPPLASNVGNTPIVLRASGAISQSKTLKCTECGAMNYPTEWYCERCGAELAAL